MVKTRLGRLQELLDAEKTKVTAESKIIIPEETQPFEINIEERPAEEQTEQLKINESDVFTKEGIPQPPPTPEETQGNDNEPEILEEIVMDSAVEKSETPEEALDREIGEMAKLAKEELEDESEKIEPEEEYFDSNIVLQVLNKKDGKTVDANEVIELTEKHGKEFIVNFLIQEFKLQRVSEENIEDALAEIAKRDDSTFQRIINKIGGESWITSVCCIETLGKIGDNRAIEPLQKIIEEGGDTLKLYCTDALENIANATKNEGVDETSDDKIYNQLHDLLENGIPDKIPEDLGIDEIRVLKRIILDNSEELELREDAIHLLNSIDRSNAVELLKSIVADKENDLKWRATCIWKLSDIDEPTVVKFLKEILMDGNENLEFKQDIINILRHYYEPGTVELLKEIIVNKKEDLEFRTTSMWILEDKDVKGTLKFLEEIMETEENEDFKYNCRFAIKRLQQKESEREETRKPDEDEVDGREIHDTLEMPVMPEIKPEKTKYELRAEELLKKLEELGSHSGNHKQCLKLSKKLAKLAKKDHTAFKKLAENAKDESNRIRYWCIRSLCFINDPKVAEELINAADIPNKTAITAIIDALAKLAKKYDKVFNTLIIDLISHNKDRSKMICADVLGQMDDPRAANALLLKLNSDIYPSCAIALGKIGDNRAVEPLKKGLASDDPAKKWASMLALEKIKTKEAIEALAEGLKTKNGKDNEKFEKALTRVLFKTRDKKIARLLLELSKNHEDKNVKWGCARVLREYNDIAKTNRRMLILFGTLLLIATASGFKMFFPNQTKTIIDTGAEYLKSAYNAAYETEQKLYKEGAEIIGNFFSDKIYFHPAKKNETEVNDVPLVPLTNLPEQKEDIAPIELEKPEPVLDKPKQKIKPIETQRDKPVEEHEPEKPETKPSPKQVPKELKLDPDFQKLLERQLKENGQGRLMPQENDFSYQIQESRQLAKRMGSKVMFSGAKPFLKRKTC